jgi:hypothetical protein
MGDAPDATFHDSLLKVYQNSERARGQGDCLACAQNLEATVSSLFSDQQASHDSLLKVYQNSEREQRARAARGQGGCLACAQNHGLARRCLSPGTEGPPCDTMQWYDKVYAIEIGEHCTRFCTTCHGLQGHSGGSQYDDRHAPTWCEVFLPIPIGDIPPVVDIPPAELLPTGVAILDLFFTDDHVPVK